MRLLRYIFVTILNFIANLFQHKNNLMEWHFRYTPSTIFIQTKCRNQFPKDDLLIAGYILFLSRYFYICDDRQINIIRELLLNAAKTQKSTEELIMEIHEKIVMTLNENERKALAQLFFMGLPPLMYSEGEEAHKVFANYAFLIFERNGQLVSTFHMSVSADIILLPLSVGILYEYVVDKLREKDKKEKLDRTIIELLESYNTIDCRSLNALGKLPVEIIKKQGLSC